MKRRLLSAFLVLVMLLSIFVPVSVLAADDPNVFIGIDDFATKVDLAEKKDEDGAIIGHTITVTATVENMGNPGTDTPYHMFILDPENEFFVDNGWDTIDKVFVGENAGYSNSDPTSFGGDAADALVMEVFDFYFNESDTFTDSIDVPAPGITPAASTTPGAAPVEKTYWILAWYDGMAPGGGLAVIINSNGEIVKTYTISYKLNGGSGTEPETVTWTTGSDPIALAEYSGTNGDKVFCGWATRTEVENADGGTDYEYTPVVLDDNGKYTPTQNIILYADWQDPKTVAPTVEYTGSAVTYGDEFTVTVTPDPKGGAWTFGTLTNCVRVSGTEGTDTTFTFRATSGTGNATVTVNQQAGKAPYVNPGTGSKDIALAKRVLSIDATAESVAYTATPKYANIAITGYINNEVAANKPAFTYTLSDNGGNIAREENSGLIFTDPGAGGATVKVTVTGENDYYKMGSTNIKTYSVKSLTPVEPKITAVTGLTNGAAVYGDTITVTVAPDANGGAWEVIAPAGLAPASTNSNKGTGAGTATFVVTDPTASAATDLEFSIKQAAGNDNDTAENTVTDTADGDANDTKFSLAKRQLTWKTNSLDATNRPYNGLYTVALTGNLEIDNLADGDGANEIKLKSVPTEGTIADANYSASAKTVTFDALELEGSKKDYYDLPATPSVDVLILKANYSTATDSWNVANIDVTATKKYNGNGNNADISATGDWTTKTIKGVNGETFTVELPANPKVNYIDNVSGSWNVGNNYDFTLPFTYFTVTGDSDADKNNYNDPAALVYIDKGSITKETITLGSITVNKIEATYGDAAVIPSYAGSLPTGVTANDISYSVEGTDAGKYAAMDSGKVVIKGATPKENNPTKIKLTITNNNYELYENTNDIVIAQKKQTLTRTDGSKTTFYLSDGSHTLTVESDAKNDTPAPTYVFAGDNNDVATVTTAGVVTFKGLGTVNITVTATETTNYKAADIAANGAITITLNVSNKADVGVTVDPISNFTYDGAEITKGELIGKVKVDNAVPADTNNVTFTFSTSENGVYEEGYPKNAGTYYVKATYEDATRKGTSDPVSFEIEQRAVTIDVTASQVYDGGDDLTAADVKTFAVKDTTPAAPGETITLATLNATYYSKNVHTNEDAIVTGATYTGIDADNYDITLNIKGSISARDITITLKNDVSKEYGQDLTLNIGNFDVPTATGDVGLITGDNLNKDMSTAIAFVCGGQAENAAADETTGYAITVEEGTSNTNYNITVNDSVKLKVNKKTIDVTGIEISRYYGNTDELTAENKTTISNLILNDNDVLTFDGVKDAIQIDWTGVKYASKDVADGIADLTVQPKLSAGGVNDNYTLNITPSFTGKIKPKQVTFDVPVTEFFPKIGTAINLTTGNAMAVNGGVTTLVENTDFRLTYSLTNANGTGITLDNGGPGLNAPNAEGDGAAVVTVTAELLGSNATNYTFAANGTAQATASKNISITVSAGNYTIEYYANGGEGTIANQTGGVNAQITLNNGSTISKTNYVFKGWAYTNDADYTDDSTYYTADENPVTLTENNLGDPLLDGGTVKLYAVWAPTYALTVNAGVGSDSLTIAPDSSDDRYEAGTEVTVTMTAKDNYVFKGWVADGWTVADADKLNLTQTITMPAGNVTLTAKWNAPLTIVAQTSISKDTSQVAGMKISDFIASATGLIGTDSFQGLFTATPDLDAEYPENGYFVGNGVLIIFYDDAERTIVSDINTLPTAAGTYYYKIMAEGGENTPNANYELQNLDATEGVLTITQAASRPQGGGGGVSTYKVTYAPGEYGSFEEGAATTETVSRGKAPTKAPTVIANDGYKFLGWSIDGETVVDLSQEKITKSITYTALYAPYGFSDGTSHLHYMIGRGEDIFAPAGNLTRAEAATILARLSPGFAEDGNYGSSSFTDVAGHWADNYIAYAQSEGIIDGYEDGSFKPDNTVTRGEFTAMIVRFKNIASLDEAAGFTDVAGHWAEDYIAALVKAGIIGGYDDGSFRPNREIARSEAAKIVNGAIGRTPDESKDLEAAGYVNKFADVSVDDWFFYNVMEATLDHKEVDFH